MRQGQVARRKSAERKQDFFEKSDALALLRPRRERPRGRRAAEKRHELATFHSITSSASARSVLGIVMRSALAVLRLTTNSNFVGRMTGKSAGFSPFRIRPV